MSMFCYQCQETAKGTGCTIYGVCGKTDEVANLQDLLLFVIKGISIYSTRLRESGLEDEAVNKFVFESLFMTITNANFDKERFLQQVREGLKLREMTRQKLVRAGGVIPANLHESATWSAENDEEFEQKSGSVGVLAMEDEDTRSLKQLITYGVKGIAAYTEHAYNLGFEDKSLYKFMQDALVATTDEKSGVDQLMNMVLETGKHGVAAMALLDKANTSSYGNPEITRVNIGVRKNPGILISGHDLRDMEDLLKQTDGSGVDIYTHSEMLPANYYPAFKKYKHFVGNYGSSWWRQKEEFETFNGPILFTTNCIVPPRKDASYFNKVYTTGAAGFGGFKHIADRPSGGTKDFTPIIEHAKKCKPPVEIEKGEITGGFAHHQVLALADKIVDAVKSGAIRKFFVMAGCDGRMKSRDYYTAFAKALPPDTVILTAGCAKYRYNKLPLGEITGIPRVLDAGQCNDSYSLAVIALKLKEIFNLGDINELPIAFNIAWYEQKAVIVLLALLYLGIKNIHLGPTLPGFLSANTAKVLTGKFGITSIGTVDDDIRLFMK
jgi:hydroxylamine reductase